MINANVIKSRLQEIHENTQLLEELRNFSIEEFSQDPKKYKLAERCLQLSIECILDICHYLISQNNWERPIDNTDALFRLAQHKVIPEKFFKKIVGLVNFRNILVHTYLKIDRKIVYENLGHLDDFRQFMKYITSYNNK